MNDSTSEQITILAGNTPYKGFRIELLKYCLMNTELQKKLNFIMAKESHFEEIQVSKIESHNVCSRL